MQISEKLLLGLMAIAIPFLAYKKKAFTLSAAMVAVALISVISISGYFNCYFLFDAYSC